MNALPRITSYGDYSSGNYGAHSLKVDLGELELYYSYETIIAYVDAKDGLVCSVNQWGVTTGKHLNWIQSDKKLRVDADRFDKMLSDAIARYIQ